MNPIHIYHHGNPLTLFVFPFPKVEEWDVEIHQGHVADNANYLTYLRTVTLERDTHLIADLWEDLDSAIGKVSA